MPLFGSGTGCPLPTPLSPFTLTRLPVPSVLVPIGTVLTEASWGGPRSVGSVPLLRDPRADSRLPVCPVASPARPARLRRADRHAPAGLRLRRLTRRPGLTRRLRSCLLRTPTPRCPRQLALPRTRSRWPVYLSCSDPARRRRRCGLDADRSRSPPPHRPGALALFGTMLSKYAGKPQVKRYFPTHRVIPGTFRLPPGFLHSSTPSPPFVHREPHNPTAPPASDSPSVVDNPCPMWVQWDAMHDRHQFLAAIIIIS
jgi:hypothetical protein